nr:ribbon-helix-helix domain-containing protein [Haliangium ochraceum]
MRTGPVTRGRPAGEPGAEHKILPLRMETETVEALDDAWRRYGLKSRMDFFRHALGSYLASLGEDELAERVQAG